jgi:hypothetical protein
MTPAPSGRSFLSPKRGHAAALLVLLAATRSPAGDGVAPNSTRATLEMHRGDLQVQLRDNSNSPRDLSGVASLINVCDAPGFDAFDPEGRGASAGLNFEHIISGHRNPNNKFTPRSGRYTLEALPKGAGARLVRRAADDPWRVASTLEYRIVEPHAIDFEFRCTPVKAELFGLRGSAIFFFADYLNDVSDVALHFRGVPEVGGRETWIAAPTRSQAITIGTAEERIATWTRHRWSTTRIPTFG